MAQPTDKEEILELYLEHGNAWDMLLIPHMLAQLHQQQLFG